MLLTKQYQRLLQLTTLVVLYAAIIHAHDPVPTEPRILGGRDAGPYEYPWIVFFESPVGHGLVATCGGSVISSNFVITAGHCCIDETTGSKSTAAIRAGSTAHIGGYSLRDMRGGARGVGRGGDTRYVARTMLHPSYVAGTNDFDVCIVQLTRPVSPYAQRVDLNFDPVLPYDYQEVRVMGWGRTALNGSQPALLQVVSLPVIPNEACVNMYGPGQIKPPIMLCAGDTLNGGKDACLGDSGGPLIIGYGPTARLVGLTSFGVGCGDKAFPGVYSRVSAFKDFVCIVTRSEPTSCPGGSFVVLHKSHRGGADDPNALSATNNEASGAVSLHTPFSFLF
eukprot:TRINITY_DN6962_c0_g5_i1.p1 TRINITY_DN6962_c0_g5~~TRINITY_DN6962_c0_g5_i1.p1  ORF type:complete len:337 (+),score=29.47 TRINITY_DN6962_c0_g5_i1:273-1283(+)